MFKRECSPISKKKMLSREVSHEMFFVTDYLFGQLIFKSITKSIDPAMHMFGAKYAHCSGI